jgi:hypothetical protein
MAPNFYRVLSCVSDEPIPSQPEDDRGVEIISLGLFVLALIRVLVALACGECFNSELGLAAVVAPVSVWIVARAPSSWQPLHGPRYALEGPPPSAWDEGGPASLAAARDRPRLEATARSSLAALRSS